jgi:integrase
VSAYYDEWIDWMKGQVRASTHDSYESHGTCYIKPILGRVQLGRLSPTDVKRFHGALRERGKTASNRRRVHATLHRMLADAVADGLIATNPTSVGRKSLERPEPYRFLTWTPAELRTFLVQSRDDRLHALYHLLALTGCRRGEALGLAWSDVSLTQTRTLSIRRTLVMVGRTPTFSEPKTTHGTRIIELDEETVAVLRAHRTRQAAEQLAAGEAWLNEDSLCFTDELGAPLPPDSVSKAFRRTATHAGLRTIRLHDLRHTWATIAMSRGVPLKVVSERLGHSDPTFTARIYQHVLPGMQREAAETVAGAILGS